MIKRRKRNIAIGFLILTHLVGILGFHTSYCEMFQKATFLHLLLSSLILFYFHPVWNKDFIIFVVFAFFTGFMIEVLGVATGDVFGHYEYGQTLGFKIWNVPVIIGVNWLLLVYLVGTIIDRLQSNILMKSLIGAGILVFMDVFIEPVAVQFDFWSWDKQSIPFLNYFAWFVVGMVLLLAFYLFKFRKQNQLAIPLFLIQLLFFAIINLTLIS